MSSQATTSFDLSRFCRAVEGRDARAQLEMYAPGATVTIVDRLAPPRSPRVLRGRDEIGAWIEDISGRDMTHRVTRSVAGEDAGAFAEACRYPGGSNVLCSTVFALADGMITDQTVVQVWDDA